LRQESGFLLNYLRKTLFRKTRLVPRVQLAIIMSIWRNRLDFAETECAIKSKLHILM